MTVKVLRVDPPPDVLKHITCKKCGAYLSYVPNDVQEYHGTDISGGPDGREWIDCPNCGKCVIIRSW